MAAETKIAWARSTFNPWKICTPVGPGCDNCYAAALSRRYGWGEYKHGVPRQRTSAGYWKQPLAWEKKAAAGDRPWRVFCASLADVFDNEVPQEWRHDLWNLILATPNLSWLLVTKRIGNVERMVPARWMNWGAIREGFPPNVRLLITVCNQEEADRDIPKLLALPCKNGISYEPALGAVDWTHLNLANRVTLNALTGMHTGSSGPGTVEHCLATLPPLPDPYARGIEWLIVGGESTQGSGKARPFDLAWARSTIAQCKAAGAPVFVKQLGSNPMWKSAVGDDIYPVWRFKNRAGADPSEWPEDLRVQCFPT